MILAMLSGGIDSVGMVYSLLKAGERLHIHHIEIENEENRTVVENVAVKNVLAYLKSVNLTNFEYTTSKVTGPTINGNFLYDSDIVNFFAGFICSSNKNIKKVALGIVKEDLKLLSSPRIQRANAMLQLFTGVEKIHPMKEYSKKELYDMLPQELKDTVWSCRTPKYEDNYAKPCNSCYTCGQMKKLSIVQRDLLLDVI